MHTKDKIIRQFGITSKYKGYRYLLDAIHIAAENYDECLKVTKDVYPVIAHKYGGTKVSVERDIRTVIAETVRREAVPKETQSEQELFDKISAEAKRRGLFHE